MSGGVIEAIAATVACDDIVKTKHVQILNFCLPYNLLTAKS